MGNMQAFHCYDHINPLTGNDNCEGLLWNTPRSMLKELDSYAVKGALPLIS